MINTNVLLWNLTRPAQPSPSASYDAKKPARVAASRLYDWLCLVGREPPYFFGAGS